MCLCINYRDGKIDVHEFEALWKYVQEWRDCFERYSIWRSHCGSGVPLIAGPVGAACVDTAVITVPVHVL